jgi:hypothetical protein
MDRDYVDGWSSVAEVVGKCVRWCREMAKRTERPMPVRRLGGVVRMYLADYSRWLSEELSAPGPSPLSDETAKTPYEVVVADPLRAVSCTGDFHVRIARSAAVRGTSVRELADDLINRALDEAGAPR